MILEKEANVKEFGKAILKADLPVKMLEGILLGSFGGQFVSALKNRKMLKDLGEEIEKKTVPASKFMKQYGPEGTIAVTTKEDVDKLKANIISKFLLKRQLPKESLGSFAVPDYGAVFTPKKVHKEIIGHEVGHLIDFEKNKPGFFTYHPLTDMLKREQAAWEESPVKKEKSDVMEKALKSYEEGIKGYKIGAGVGAGAGLAISLPTLIKYLKK